MFNRYIVALAIVLMFLFAVASGVSAQDVPEGCSTITIAETGVTGTFCPGTGAVIEVQNPVADSEAVAGFVFFISIAIMGILEVAKRGVKGGIEWLGSLDEGTVRSWRIYQVGVPLAAFALGTAAMYVDVSFLEEIRIFFGLNDMPSAVAGFFSFVSLIVTIFNAEVFGSVWRNRYRIVELASSLGTLR